MHVCRIVLFPIKSLDGISVPSARLLPSGALEHDRRFAIVDDDGRVVNAKRTAAIHRLQAAHDLSANEVTVTRPETQPKTFSLPDDHEALARWLSEHFGFPVHLEEDTRTGFPDDRSAGGPTIISTQTIELVAEWFRLAADEVRQRFRANIEVDADTAFAEDQLFGNPGESVLFEVGEVALCGTNPCQRCAVPSRSPTTGDVLEQFVRRFSDFRQQSLPAWVARGAFDHFYRLAVNTKLAAAPADAVLRVGDPVSIMT